VSSQKAQLELFHEFARVADGLAHGHRIALLELLAQGERDVDTLARLLGLPVASVSQHLQRLRRAGLVTAHREGRRRVYRLASTNVAGLVGLLQRLAEQSLADVEKLVDDEIRARDPQPPVKADELRELLERGEVLLLDVRPEEEFLAAHVAGAINVPLQRLAEQAETFPRDRDIVVYCRGPYCLLTLDALQVLRDRGLRVRRLEAGVPTWRAAGLPVAERSTASNTP
jgi:rhodanese-related sulfurtransferase/predicted transcriptional regulator